MRAGNILSVLAVCFLVGHVPTASADDDTWLHLSRTRTMQARKAFHKATLGPYSFASPYRSLALCLNVGWFTRRKACSPEEVG